MRRTFRRAPRAVRKKAIWVNIPFSAVAYSETVGTQLLLTAEDWEAQFTSLGNETAVLRAVVGEISFMPAVVGAAGGVLFWGLYVHDKDATVAPTFTTSGMSNVDWLRVGTRPGADSVTANVLKGSKLFNDEIHIKAKRKLKSRDGIFLAAQYGGEAATPSGFASGLLRFLVARD